MIGLSQIASGQTADGTITQAPCNDDGIYTITTTGLTPPVTYTYYVGQQTIVHSNVNSTTDVLTDIPMTYWGDWSCIVTSGTSSAFTGITFTPQFIMNISVVQPICPQTLGTITATNTGGSTGPFDYEWTNSQSLISYTGNNIDVPLGNYSALITDQGTGCVLNITDTAATVFQLSTVTASMSSTPASCDNGTATAVGAGGVAPYTYSWVTGAVTPTITDLTQNYYSLLVTDAQGCISTNVGVNVVQNPVISVNTTITDATCLESDGSVIAFGSGGLSPYSYVWSNGQTDQTAVNLGEGGYTVIATDANGCSGQGFPWVNASTPITVTYTSTPSQCISPTGSAIISPVGGSAPYTYFWYTSPPVTTQTLSNVSPGNYSFQVTDALGCIRTGSAVVDPISMMSANANGAEVTCPGTTGDAQITASSGILPYTYLWSNGGTTNEILAVPIGSYSCTVTDALGCSITKSANIVSVSPLNVGVSTTGASCIFNSDGTATATATGGLAPYTYSHSNGETTISASGLAVGWGHSVTVTDANGCSKTKYFNILNSNTTTDCYCTIEGNVYVDGNTNCTFDTGETAVQNVMIHCSGIGYTFTNVDGYYSFQVPTGSYTVSEEIQAYYPLATCQTNGIDVNVVAAVGCTSVVDFANNMEIISDVKIVTMSSFAPPIPGNAYQQKVIVKNIGTVTESDIQLGYEHDGQLTYFNSTFPSFIQLNNLAEPNHYSIETGFPVLDPNITSAMILTYQTPTNIPIGTVVDFFDTTAVAAPIATSWLADYSPWNNVNTYQPTVISSYDPNYKEVTPKGFGPEGYISSETIEFDYTIHFQNEGTYFAQNIYVTDQLDDDLDWTTLRPGYSEYDYTTTVSETGLITFTFANINLPWKSQYGDALSSSMVSFSIDRKDTNPQGTEFTNSADIYFDYNAPITTNTTLNTLNDAIFANVDESEPQESIEDAITVDLYPVPSNDMITIRVNNVSKSETASIMIIDLMGNVVKNDKLVLSEGTTLISKNVSDLATGTYLTRIQFENGTFIVMKIVMQ